MTICISAFDTIEIVSPSSFSADPCSDGWFGQNGFCYKFNEDNLNWASAHNACSENGSSLVDIQSQSENDFLLNFIPNGVVSVLIGYRSTTIKGTFAWDRTERVGMFSLWQTGEPKNSTDKRCTAMTRTVQGQWRTVSCATDHPSICKKGTSHGHLLETALSFQQF